MFHNYRCSIEMFFPRYSTALALWQAALSGQGSLQRVINDFPAVLENALTYPLDRRLYLAQLRSHNQHK
ncbi:hypothetical protein QUB63_23685 [Microcoleus sp. ARI1-B5]|uniref:hypothetical protein n=1 Tax=unclassified Microcoleus TaxID=2642155 RepID=UPI002FD12589